MYVDDLGKVLNKYYTSTFPISASYVCVCVLCAGT